MPDVLWRNFYPDSSTQIERIILGLHEKVDLNPESDIGKVIDPTCRNECDTAKFRMIRQKGYGTLCVVWSDLVLARTRAG